MKERIFRRGSAFVIDLLLISMLFTLVYNFLPLGWLKGEQALGNLAFRWDVDLYGVMLAGYFLTAGLLFRGGSPGKDIMHLKTVMKDGGIPSRTLGLARSILKLLSIALLPLAVLVYLWGGRETTLQDILARTRVERLGAVGLTG